MYPRSQIYIFVQVLHADGGELPVSINAITLALIDGGIVLNDFVVASSAGYLQKAMLCDLTYAEEVACASASHRAKPAHAKAQSVPNGVKTTAGIIRKSYGGGY
ncbi:hypothetical protein PsorP6_010006 [Peronosclerospora sorghi]|uniref:Uncharacterized protein n=1 Tax=Peronosclerospora sorghi TaxID=230839 RepID=A0ACC0VX41_9STRA|nr:hypothetical protein PsorP6_010006 [Peronosclerospora sorghi]